VPRPPHFGTLPHCRLCEPVWATGRRACRAGCLGLSMFCPFCHVCVRRLRRVHPKLASCVSGSRSLDARWTEPREARFQVSACGGVSGFEAEDGQAATGLGRAGSRRLPRAGINQNFAYLARDKRETRQIARPRPVAIGGTPRGCTGGQPQRTDPATPPLPLFSPLSALSRSSRSRPPRHSCTGCGTYL
jgi:hypothetical protein